MGIRNFVPDVAIVGPRFAINVAMEDEPLGFDRVQYPALPLLVMQNKMYQPKGWREIVGNLTAKLVWARASGTIAAFTWLTRHREFTNRSGVPHHWLPFGVDPNIFGRYAAQLGSMAQPYDVGFTGASGSDKYPLRRALLDELHTMKDVRVFTGEWVQTLLNRQNNHSWKALDHNSYALQMAQTKIWISTTGPEDIVGTRYFETLMSGTTLLLCNRPKNSSWAYDGLFKDGEHVVVFEGVADMAAKVMHYLGDEPERQRLVRNAHALAQRLHTWDARARFVTMVAEEAIRRQAARNTPYYVAPPIKEQGTELLGCFAAPKKTGPQSVHQSGLKDPPRSRNKRKLHRYTVQSCQDACKPVSTGFGLIEGGFSSGNGHALARCVCIVGSAGDQVQAEWGRRQLPARDCATACTLHDSRPCGGRQAVALFRYTLHTNTKVLPGQAGSDSAGHKARRGHRKGKGRQG